MNRNEFKSRERYLLALKDENQSKTEKSIIRSKEFYSLVPLLLAKYPDILVRDFLEVDGTFAIAFPKTQTFALQEALNVYLDLIDTLTWTTYSEVKQTGYVDYEEGDTDIVEEALTGFWVLLK